MSVKKPVQSSGNKSPEARVKIFTDGACSGNPGPGGWGVLLIADTENEKNIRKEICGGAAATTNNRMELTAAIKGLTALKWSCHVDIFTDSKYVMDGISEWIKKWRCNGWKNARNQPVQNADLWEALDKAQRTHQVKWHWVKGHNNHPENEQADALARAGMKDYQPKPENHPRRGRP